MGRAEAKKTGRQAPYSRSDVLFMRRCLELAEQGRPSPNPFVGALIVDNESGKIIGEGYHRRAGEKHAEVEAIESVRRHYGPAQAALLFARSSLYVNLEPCNHYGKQPPCTRAIIGAKIPKVVFAMKDPNPNVKGGGAQALECAGIEVRSGILESEARALNAPFLHHARTGQAYVTLKMAMSKDGQVATHSKRTRFISSPASRKRVQRMRARCPAIMVGIGTVKADNPRLTCRIKGGRYPLRIVVDQSLQIDENARVLQDRNVLLVCARPKKRGPKAKLERLQKRGISFFFPPFRADGLLDLGPAMERAAQMGADHVLLEGGPGLAQDMLERKLVDEIVLFRSPKSVGRRAPGPMAQAIERIRREARAHRVALPLHAGPDSVQVSIIRPRREPLSFWAPFFKP